MMGIQECRIIFPGWRRLNPKALKLIASKVQHNLSLHTVDQMEEMSQWDRFWLDLNWCGRSLLYQTDQIPIGLWPHIFARADRNRWECESGVHLLYYMVRELVDLLLWYEEANLQWRSLVLVVGKFKPTASIAHLNSCVSDWNDLFLSMEGDEESVLYSIHY